MCGCGIRCHLVADTWACMAFVKSPCTQGVAEWSTGWVWGSGSRCRLNPGLSLTCYTLLGKSSNFSASVFSGVKWGYRLPHGITAGINWDELGGSDSKEPACNAGDPCSIPGLGRSPGEGNVYSLQHSCWRIHGQRSLVSYSPWGRKESDTTEWLTHNTIWGPCTQASHSKGGQELHLETVFHAPLPHPQTWDVTHDEAFLSRSL